jgi:hypothetical protein
MLNATAQQYAAHWATLTGRSAREVYVPEALRSVQVGQRVEILEGLGKGRKGRVSVIGKHGVIVDTDHHGRTVVALNREGGGWKRC